MLPLTVWGVPPHSSPEIEKAMFWEPLSPPSYVTLTVAWADSPPTITP